MFEEIGKLIDKKEAPGNLERAIEMLEKLKGEHRANDVVRGKLAHAHFYRGYLAPEGSREREDLFEKGVSYGKEALALNPRAVYGNYWYGANLGMLGMCKGVMASLRSIDPMHKAMTVVLEENERFYFGGPHRSLGRLYHQAPGWPISIGKKGKAMTHLERAVQIGPNFFHNRVLFAELLIDVGKKKQAGEHLDFVLDSPLNPDHKIEDGNYQRQARALRTKLF
jgi:tetratricopeptide (TPR) repeat protein